MPASYTSIINGARSDAEGAEQVRENPARKNETAARWHAAGAATVQRAAESASNALHGWARIPSDERRGELRELLAAVERAAPEFARRITRENGKTLAESAAEMKSALVEARFLLEEAGRPEAPIASTDAAVEVRVDLAPVGMFLLVTPWNFPIATILRKLIPALAHGNTAVVKPSELAPGPAHLLFELMAERKPLAPAAALLLGRGPDVVPLVLRHESLRGVSFTGSTAAGLEIARQVAGRDVRLQLEMGGKNTAVVLDDADLDLAAQEIARGAFSCAGQWCTGTGRVVASRAIAEALVARLTARADALRVGAGDEANIDMGPVVSGSCVARTRAQVDEAVQQGAQLKTNGRTDSIRLSESGYFVAPTVIAGITREMALWTEELFAPVLPLAVARDDAEAVELANAGRYGLSASVFSENETRALAVGERIESGMLHVNLHTAYRQSALPVAGWRESGRGVPECGRFARDFFTRPRAVYRRRTLS